MKEVYLAMDKDGRVFGYHSMPKLNTTTGEWIASKIMDGCINTHILMNRYGIDATEYRYTHETPIKLRAVWEEVAQ